MHVIILAAGQSHRFREAGYSVPKPFLEIEWHGLSVYMLQHVINTVPRCLDCEISIAVSPGYVFDAPRIKSYPIEKTKGPAHTALQMMEMLVDKPRWGGYLIIDSDILNFTNDLNKLVSQQRSAVLVKKSANPAYSYVDLLGKVGQIKEKERISVYAIQGAYFVPGFVQEEFMGISNQIIEKEQEPFISQVLNALLHHTNPVRQVLALETTYTPIDWGTPHDVELSGAKIITGRE